MLWAADASSPFLKGVVHFTAVSSLAGWARVSPECDTEITDILLLNLAATEERGTACFSLHISVPIRTLGHHMEIIGLVETKTKTSP